MHTPITHIIIIWYKLPTRFGKNDRSGIDCPFIFYSVLQDRISQIWSRKCQNIQLITIHCCNRLQLRSECKLLLHSCLVFVCVRFRLSWVIAVWMDLCVSNSCRIFCEAASSSMGLEHCEWDWIQIGWPIFTLKNLQQCLRVLLPANFNCMEVSYVQFNTSSIISNVPSRCLCVCICVCVCIGEKSFLFHRG